MRLFTAAIPPPEVADHLEAALASVPGMTYRAPRAAWHITLGYYGEEDPAGRIPWVRSRLTSVARPRVALAKLGNFGETLLMRVSTPDKRLADLAAVLRWDDKHPEYIPHLTVGRGPLVDLPYAGPEWTVDEVVLLGAEKRHDYTVVDRIGLPA
ncbi:2'-5' RNA ligase [Kibdelosporangium banguiense]|uniref:2'-5' RNA ligase n=1 Tax=Kibdelosporangium banguiense TaxID=1365924 RepID=A0ABS4TJA0_9PSEU|nr:2'-5' RNA ligase family protein [Kibdelosporangium banguiense]MBP2323921.1 2'-5' RNA ligase [Kibdelosporangium banguiense]